MTTTIVDIIVCVAQVAIMAVSMYQVCQSARDRSHCSDCHDKHLVFHRAISNVAMKSTYSIVFVSEVAITEWEKQEGRRGRRRGAAKGQGMEARRVV